MNKSYMIVAIVLGALLFIGQQIKQEYNQAVANANLLRLQFTEAIETSTEAVKSFKETSDSIRDAISDIKERLARVELSQLELAQTTAQSLQDNAAKLDMKLDALQVAKQPEPKGDTKPAKPRIIMHSGDGCGPCNNWISKTMPSWQANGWDVQIVKEVSSPRGWPWFEVYPLDGKRFEVDGPLTRESYEQGLRGAK